MIKMSHPITIHTIAELTHIHVLSMTATFTSTAIDGHNRTNAAAKCVPCEIKPEWTYPEFEGHNLSQGNNCMINMQLNLF